MKKSKLVNKFAVIVSSVAVAIAFTIGAGAVDYSGNIYYTGEYDCSPNTNGNITITKEQIGVMAFMTDMNVFIRATTKVGGITSNYFTAKFTNPAKCDINGSFTNGRIPGEVTVQGDVDIRSQSLFGEKYIKVTNRGGKVNNVHQTFIKPFSRHYY